MGRVSIRTPRKLHINIQGTWGPAHAFSPSATNLHIYSWAFFLSFYVFFKIFTSPLTSQSSWGAEEHIVYIHPDPASPFSRSPRAAILAGSGWPHLLLWSAPLACGLHLDEQSNHMFLGLSTWSHLGCGGALASHWSLTPVLFIFTLLWI